MTFTLSAYIFLFLISLIFVVVVAVFGDEWDVVMTSDREARVIFDRNRTTLGVRRASIVVSLTTLPSRIHSIQYTLRSLALQSYPPTAIHLYLPDQSVREKRGYQVPSFVHTLGIQVRSGGPDYGPATKLIPALLEFHVHQPEQLVVYVDDDILYHRHWLRDLVAAHEKLGPRSSVCMRGWRVPRSLSWKTSETLRADRVGSNPVQVDIVTGCGGVLIRPSFFNMQDVLDYNHAPREAFFVDDIWFSGHLAKQRVPKYVIPSSHYHSSKLLAVFMPQFRNSSLISNVNGNGKNNDVLLNWFKDDWMYAPHGQ
jgi:hypothetical protein